VATSRPVRIPRSRAPRASGAAPTDAASEPAPRVVPSVARRANVAGTQRAIRLSALFVGVLGALYAAFALYARDAPGGAASPATNGLLLFTVIFVLFAVVGAVYSLSPAPRSIEVANDRVTVVGRWGRRTNLPPLDRLWVSVARSYRAGFFSNADVKLVEVWADDTPRRSYLVDAELFSGAQSPGRSR